MRLSARYDSARFAKENWECQEPFHAFDRDLVRDVYRRGRGEPVVLIPGLAGGHRLLAPLARRLARNHRVISIGLHGDRGWPGSAPNQTPADHARDLADRLDRLGLERPTIVGVSFGAAVALELAIGFPRCVGSLVLSGVEGTFRPNLATRIAATTLERFPLPKDNPFVNQFFNILHGCRPTPGPLVDFIVRRCWETDQCIVARRLRGLEGFDVRDRLSSIDAPTLVIAGSRDVVIPPARQKHLAETLNISRFETIEGAGHVGFLTHRSEFARLVARMVRECQKHLC